MIPFALVVIVFSAVNRDLISLDLWPLPNEITVPVFTLVLAVFIFGFLFGAIVAWVSAGAQRRKARNGIWRAETAERELRSLKNTLHDRERELRDVKESIESDDKNLITSATKG